MLRVEIHAPSPSSWVDHLGNKIDKLVFSKKYEPNYIAGHYPLESFGSVYRNIDNFCESPLQSGMDWEIRIPMIYSSPDGSFKTIDLLYWLESINESGEFNLIGCDVFLKDENETIYSSMVESIQSGDGVSSIRMSEWIGNPKISKSDFPISIGVSDVSRWKPAITEENGYINIQISSSPLKSRPNFYIKIGERFLPIARFRQSETDDDCEVEYSVGYSSAIIKAKGVKVYELPEDIGPDDEILLPTTGIELGPLQYPIIAPAIINIFRPEGTPGAPVNYSIGEGDNFELLEAWADGYWLSPANLSTPDKPKNVDGYSLGRAERSKRRSHRKGEAIVKVESIGKLDIVTGVPFTVESILGYGSRTDTAPPYMTGSSSQLAHNSRGKGNIDWEQCPRFLCVSGNYSEWAKEKLYSTGLANFIINLDPGGVPDDARIVTSGLMFIGLKTATPDPFYYTLNGEPISSKHLADGAIYGFDYTVHSTDSLTVGDLRKRLFALELDKSATATDAEFQAIDALQVGYFRLDISAQYPLDIKNLYVSGKLRTQSSAGDSETGLTVKPVVETLLAMGGIKGTVSEVGGIDGLCYGRVINREAFALRDKLRSLAAESATLIRFNPKASEIFISDVSLEKDIDPVFIPLSVFLLENNVYSFKMETSEISEILYAVAIHWGKDIETDKYMHTLSVAEAKITQDGYETEPYIEREKWSAVFGKMSQKSSRGIGTSKSVDAEWITNWEAAEKFAYNLLRWNCAVLRKANARLIFPELEGLGKTVDIGTFVSFALPGYPEKFSKTTWVVTGRHDDLDSFVTILELLEVSDLSATPPNRYLLLEDGANLLYEDGGKIKLEDFYG